MVILGLTGSIGMGKSTAARMLRRLGVPVHDADRAVHQALAPGGSAVAEVAMAFGPEVLEGRGVDRRRLGARVFQNPGALKRLEAILHPLVRRAERRFLAVAAQRRTKVVALDVPLLFETGGIHRVDATVVVSAPPFVQKARVLARPGMTPDKLEGILRRQLPDRLKRRHADFLVLTGLSKANALRALARIVRIASGARGRKWPARPAPLPHRPTAPSNPPCAKSSLIPKPPASSRKKATASSKSAASSW